MKQSDIYLKEGVDKKQLLEEFENYCCENDNGYITFRALLAMFLNSEVKPTLTEDEKVILRNTKGMYYIRRSKSGDLVIMTGYMENVQHEASFYNHLFQFIKPGEEYKISDLLEE